MFKLKYNTAPREEWKKRINIYTNWYENDFEFEVDEHKATGIVLKFRTGEPINIVEDWTEYWINPSNIIALEID